MNTYIVRTTKYDTSRPHEVVCVNTRLVVGRYAEMKQAMRRMRVLAGRA